MRNMGDRFFRSPGPGTASGPRSGGGNSAMACRSSKSGLAGKSAPCRQFTLQPPITRFQTAFARSIGGESANLETRRPEQQSPARTRANETSSWAAGTHRCFSPAAPSMGPTLICFSLLSHRHGNSVAAYAVVQAGRPLLRSAFILHPSASSSFQVRLAVAMFQWLPTRWFGIPTSINPRLPDRRVALPSSLHLSAFILPSASLSTPNRQRRAMQLIRRNAVQRLDEVIDRQFPAFLN